MQFDKYLIHPLTKNCFDYYKMMIKDYTKKKVNVLDEFRNKIKEWSKEDKEVALLAFLAKEWNTPSDVQLLEGEQSLFGVRLLGTLCLDPAPTFKELMLLITAENKDKVYSLFLQGISPPSADQIIERNKALKELIIGGSKKEE